jgi:hypothetical protein
MLTALLWCGRCCAISPAPPSCSGWACLRASWTSSGRQPQMMSPIQVSLISTRMIVLIGFYASRRWIVRTDAVVCRHMVLFLAGQVSGGHRAAGGWLDDVRSPCRQTARRRRGRTSRLSNGDRYYAIVVIVVLMVVVAGSGNVQHAAPTLSHHRY